MLSSLSWASRFRRSRRHFRFLVAMKRTSTSGSASPPLNTLAKHCFEGVRDSFGRDQVGLGCLWFAGRPDGVQPSAHALGDERGLLRQLQGALQTVEPRQDFPGGEGRKVHPSAKELPTLGFG